VNGIYFGNNGELYIAIGGNTNAGIAGELSRNLLMRENYFSSAILVANLGSPSFNGFITYDAVNDGTPITGFGPNGVEVFASGLRNPFGVVMHSNGKIYATDNGPNAGFGDMATGCGPGQFIPDVYDSDELNLIVRNAWYGHPNHKRAQTDPRQCVWKGSAVPSSSDYTAPLMKLRSSTDGIIEYQANYFGGEMRSNLIASKYGDGLYRIILSPDGNSVASTSIPAIALAGDNGLAVTQAPNGNLIDARYDTNECYVFIPEEPLTTALQIFSVFPRRGGLLGGSTVTIYGANFVAQSSFAILVFVGGSPCTNVVVVNSASSILRCTLPSSSSIGRKDVVVDVGNGVVVTLPLAYLYVTGRP
jgi:IPT/TIG domain/Glucose / Sorbosone dehydrogenase